MTYKEQANQMRKICKDISAAKQAQEELRQRARYASSSWNVAGVSRSSSPHDRTATFISRISELDVVICEKLIRSSQLYLSFSDALDEQCLTGETKRAMLKYINGDSYKEIARSLHSTPDNVRRRIGRVLDGMGESATETI